MRWTVAEEDNVAGPRLIGVGHILRLRRLERCQQDGAEQDGADLQCSHEPLLSCRLIAKPIAVVTAKGGDQGRWVSASGPLTCGPTVGVTTKSMQVPRGTFSADLGCCFSALTFQHGPQQH